MESVKDVGCLLGVFELQAPKSLLFLADPFLENDLPYLYTCAAPQELKEVEQLLEEVLKSEEQWQWRMELVV